MTRRKYIFVLAVALTVAGCMATGLFLLQAPGPAGAEASSSGAPPPAGYEPVEFGSIPENSTRVVPEQIALFELPDSAPKISHTMVFDTARLRTIWRQLDPDGEVPSIDLAENAVLVVYFPRGETPASPDAYAREQGTHIVLELGRYANERTDNVAAEVYRVPTEYGQVSTVDLRPGPPPTNPTPAPPPPTSARR